MKTPLGKSYKFVRGVPQTYRAGKAAGGRVNGAKAVAKDLKFAYNVCVEYGESKDEL